ncbi:hypothetical protein GCK72_007859 [Caenorhabditis remanei]|uniref:DUF38 domain-containing protein n=1 Tax=Caenorhabditis remanei TaxID=31234 RepID=A0A6A5HIB6_CAERE|nr:hypothetical protein GCK72_007859 [Caenorhabditis remanei]KAF1767900.1 hypothetical protein GCK72_007859 [Caenorhabditis remanei]
MENQEVLRSKPLSYEASKAVLKSLSLETRETINRQIPALRGVNSRLPYILENLIIENRGFETNGRRWVIELTWDQSNPLSHVVESRIRVVTIYDYNSHKKAAYRVNKSDEEIWYQLFDEYIRNGTVVRGSLCFRGIPEFLKRRRENEVELRMKVTNLGLDIHETEDYDHSVRFIDLDVLENVEVLVGKNTLAILDKSDIKTCKSLTVIVTHGPDFPSVDQLRRLRNQHLYLKFYGFKLHNLHLFVKDWITTGRDIGTRFSWGPRPSEDVQPIMEHLKTHSGAVKAGSNLAFYFSDKAKHDIGITLKMGEDRELVMFCKKIRSESFSYCHWSFEMEVVASTNATGTVSTPGV